MSRIGASPSLRRGAAAGLLIAAAAAGCGLFVSGGGVDTGGGGFTYFRSLDIEQGDVEIRAARATRDGGAILVGALRREIPVYSAGGSTSTYAVQQSLAVIRADATGNRVWSREINAPSQDYFFRGLRAAVQTADGGWLLAGDSVAGRSALAKLDANLAFVWQRSYPGELERRIRTLVATPDNGAVLAGSLTRATGASSGNTWLWLAKVDAQGRLEHENTVLEDISGATRVHAYADTFYAVAGYEVVEVDQTLATVITRAGLRDSAGRFSLGLDVRRYERSALSGGPGFFALPEIVEAQAIERVTGDLLWQETSPEGAGYAYKGLAADSGNPDDFLAVTERQSSDENGQFPELLRRFQRTAPDAFAVADQSLPAFTAGQPAPQAYTGMLGAADGSYLLTGYRIGGELWIGRLSADLQQWHWVQTSSARYNYWYGDQDEYDTTLVQTDDDGDGAADDGFLVTIADVALKLDADGQPVFDLAPRRSQDQEQGFAVVEAPDGGFFIAAGTRRPVAGEPGGAGLLRLEADGRLRWRRVLPGVTGANDLVETSDGNLVLLATNYNYIGDAPGGPVLTKLSNEGQILWQVQRPHVTDAGLPLDSLIATTDGGVLALAHGLNRLYKLNAAGAREWTRGVMDGARLEAVVQAADGGYWLAHKRSVRPDPAGDVLAIPVLTRLAADGTTRFSQSYDLALADYEPLRLHTTPENGVVLAATIPQTGTAPARCQDPDRDPCGDLLLLHAGPDGAVRWTRSYGSAGDEQLGGIAGAADNGFLVWGETNGFGYPYYGAALLRTDADGNVASIGIGPDGQPISSCPVSLGARLAQPSRQAVQPQNELVAASFDNGGIALVDSASVQPESFDPIQIRACLAESQAPVVRVALSGPGRVTSDPPGIDCGADCEQAYATFTRVTLTAEPLPDARFEAWGGHCSGTSPAFVIEQLPGDRLCEARFSSATSGQSPQPGFIVYDEYGPGRELAAGDPLVFDASVSRDDGSIVSYQWDFDGDGAYEITRSTPQEVRTYTTPGVYNARLQAIDDTGLSAVFNGFFEVVAAPANDNTFSLVLDPSQLTLPQAGAGSVQVDASRGSFTGDAVQLRVESCPAGAVCSLSSDIVMLSNPQPVTLSVDAGSLAPGAYAVSLFSYGQRGGGNLSSAIRYDTLVVTVN